MRILYFYKWCTFGGVERVLINRAMAFKKHNINVKMDIYFFYPGVINAFKEFLRELELEDYLSVVDKFRISDYDLFISIDTEEAFEVKGIKNFILEYHTCYENHGKYIYKVSAEKVRHIIVPSQYSKELLEKKRPDFKGKIFILRNFVIDYEIKGENFGFPDWKLRPVIWIGRIDELKNPYFLVEGVKLYLEQYGDKAFFCAVGNALDEENFIHFIKQAKMTSRTVWYPSLRFDKLLLFLKLIKKRGAIFVSASSAESFGMSVAEAISYGLPVLISDIPSHRKLVNNKEEFLFSAGNKMEFTKKLNNIINNYEIYSGEIALMGKNFSYEQFLDDWERFVKIQSK